MSGDFDFDKVNEVYKKLGYKSQSDYFDKQLPIYNKFLSFEEYSKQLEEKTIYEPIEILDDTEIKFEEKTIYEPIEILDDTEIKFEEKTIPEPIEILDDTEIKFEEKEIIEFDYTPNMFYANLAKDAYNPVGDRKDFLNYKYLEEESTENLATYVNEKKKELSFAIPGTSKAGDMIMDAGIAVGSVYPLLSLDGRYEKISNKIKEVKNKYDDYNISVTGHSAGGSLANYLGVENPNYAINTFNMGQGLPFLTNTIKCKLGNCENINNFRIVGDWASSLSDAFSPGKVFNMKPIIPTDEMNLQAESQDTFYYPTYMGLPHNINQFIDRDQNQELSDYGQYGRKLSATIGGVAAAVGLPYAVKKINTAVNMAPGGGTDLVMDDDFREQFMEQYKGMPFMRSLAEYLDVVDDIGGDVSVESLMQRDYAMGQIVEITTPIILGANPSLRYASNFFGGLANMNDVVGGIVGFGVGDVIGTALYESVLKPDATPLKSKKTFKSQTEITDLDSEKYFSNTLTSIALGGGMLAAGLGGVVGYLV